MIGQTLNNRYTITTRIGKGAMGTVFRATDTQSRREVALKIISSELAIDPEMLERFKREGEALSKLKHPNIVSYLDAFQHDDHYVIAMEYVPGGSLYDLIKSEPLPIDRARQIALDLCDALIRAHRLNIIHRDLKPENILLDEDGTPKLADFGVARLTEGTRMTRTGTKVGTPYYMAPEAWEGKTLDAQADIWSLGVILFEMLTGQVPFDGDTGATVMNKVFTTPPPNLKKFRPEVPVVLAKIVSRMLTRDNNRRYQTMRQVAVELESGRSASVPKPSTVPRLPASNLSALFNARLWLIAGLVILGILAAMNLSTIQSILFPPDSGEPVKTPTTATTRATAQSLSIDPDQTLASSRALRTDCPSPEVFCVGLVTQVGAVDDKSFNLSAWEALVQAEKELEAQVMFIETIVASDYAKNIAILGDAGYDVIVTVGYEVGEETIAASIIYPDISFIGVDQFQAATTEGVAGLIFPEDQAGFLVGALAAGMSETHIIGAVCGTDDVPSVWRFGEGYRAGAAHVDNLIGTSTEVIVVYHNDVSLDRIFTDPEWGAAEAVAMMDRGADIIFGCGGETGNGAVTAAARAGAYVIGVDTDQYYTLPDAAPRMLSSALKLITPGVFDLIIAAKEGAFPNGNIIGEAGYAPFHDLEEEIPVAAKAIMDKLKEELESGAIQTNVPATKP
jgi:basic membrane protein A